MRKGQFQKRWFSIDVHIEDDSNYKIDYFHSPDDRKPRGSFPLENSVVLLSGGTSFTITFYDDTQLAVMANSTTEMDEWIQSLEKVITVATARDKYFKDRRKMEVSGLNASPNRSSSPNRNATHQPQNDNVSIRAFSQANKRTVPTVRIDVDINTIPPRSSQRQQFEEMIINDFAKALNINANMIDVLNIKPAVGMSWLSLIEFDFYIPQGEAEYDENDYEKISAIEEARDQQRIKLLKVLHEMIINTSSPLYNGFITCKLDPTFSKNLLEKDDDEYEDVELFSAESEVLKIMKKYENVLVPKEILDSSHFNIFLSFEGNVKPLPVPNPLILRRRCCTIWPFEVKQVLGLTGTMADLFLEPRALVPKDMPKALSSPIVFESCARLGGAIAINASHLKADMTYEVIMDDSRDDELNKLTDEEFQSIKSVFDQYDIDNDGGISKKEVDELVRLRIMDRKDAIDKKYEDFVKQPNLSTEDLAAADANRKLYLSQLNESQSKLLQVFEAADINRDGIISFKEFLLAETWWLRCSLNPDQQHLF
jgi:Ca2+-binding EF-hand superfamily protein